MEPADGDGRSCPNVPSDKPDRLERHFIARFRAQFGTSPKTLARIIRFGRAVRGLSSGRTVSLTDLAQDCGYYDQSHFIRDFHAFAGDTPTELAASRLPDSGFVVK